MMLRRALLASALAAPAASRPLGAQPARNPVRLVVPFPAGGATDSISRLYAPVLAAKLGEPVVIENRPGGGGIPAAEAVTRAAPDGLTLLFTTSSTHSVQPAVNPRGLPYDPERDFTPLALICGTPSIVLISSTIPATTLGEFIAWARQRRGQVNYGSSGVGTAPHLNGALLDVLADLGMEHVPYRGTGQVYAEMRRGEVHVLLDSPSTAAPHLQSGAVRAVAVTWAERTELVPGVPTTAEAGLPGLLTNTWFGLFGPARLPAEVKARLDAATLAAAQDAEFRQRLFALGAEARPGGAEVLTRTAREERERWAGLVQQLRIQVQ
ncbi:Bug family tripartite tricarboxylate transporter substrate binding protein [Roseococcus sp. DSY-14]|uniref:Bug family tripartite tricarboxylate transporter substrate binding protein n=1 Tax=Roseococcus sp. DSY-14 TaxID=3369650 RepID=UPI00387A885A